VLLLIKPGSVWDSLAGSYCCTLCHQLQSPLLVYFSYFEILHFTLSYLRFWVQKCSFSLSPLQKHPVCSAVPIIYECLNLNVLGFFHHPGQHSTCGICSLYIHKTENSTSEATHHRFVNITKWLLVKQQHSSAALSASQRRLVFVIICYYQYKPRLGLSENYP